MAGMKKKPDEVKKPDDGLEIPAHLKRESNEATKRLAARIVDTPKEWKMLDTSKRATPLTKEPEGEPELNYEDENLPVEVNFRKVGQLSSLQTFANLDAFEEWYDPEKYRIVGSLATAGTTMVDVIERVEVALPKAHEPPAPLAKADKRKGKRTPKVEEPLPERRMVASYVHGKVPLEPPAPKAPVGRGAVIKPPPAKAKALPKSKTTPTPKVSASSGKGRGGNNAGSSQVRHGCKVNDGDKIYKSVYAAFLDLGLKISAHPKFRKELKLTKKGTLEYVEGGKKYKFDLVGS